MVNTGPVLDVCRSHFTSSVGNFIYFRFEHTLTNFKKRIGVKKTMIFAVEIVLRCTIIVVLLSSPRRKLSIF